MRLDGYSYFMFNFKLGAAVFLLLCALFPEMAMAADNPFINLSVGATDNPEQITNSIKIVAMLTVLAMAPSILILTTSFTRIIVVFSFLKMALGTQQSPPSQVLIGMALIMTVFIMMPVWHQIDEQAITPYNQKLISSEQFLEKAVAPIKGFMGRFTRDEDIKLFVDAGKYEGEVKEAKDLPLYILTPSFILSELRTAFEIGFMIYLPFVIIDIVVSAVLMSMGMMMLPPMMISLPIKIALFVLVDGWHLLVGNLLASYGAGG